MKIFKSDILKTEFNTLIKEILPVVANCGNCGIFCCDGRKKFSVTCRQCREQRCSNCYIFESSIEILLNNGDKNSKNYVSNLINDFLSMNEITAIFFNTNISNKVV